MATSLHEEVVVVGIIWDPLRKNMNNPGGDDCILGRGITPRRKYHDLQLIKKKLSVENVFWPILTSLYLSRMTSPALSPPRIR